jgi:hypothetical protein
MIPDKNSCSMEFSRMKTNDLLVKHGHYQKISFQQIMFPSEPISVTFWFFRQLLPHSGIEKLDLQRPPNFPFGEILKTITVSLRWK